jgi:acyl-CoA thioesterase
MTDPQHVHPLDAGTRLTPGRNGRLAGHTSDAYWNFGGPFGGYTAAVLMRAVMDDPRRLGPPVAQTVNFCAPIVKGAFEVDLKLQRDGKATQHWSLELHQAGIVAATASIICANRRQTFAHTLAVPPDVPAPEAVPLAPTNPRLPWLDSYEFRFVEGGPRFDSEKIPEGQLGPSRTVLWLADRPRRPLDYTALSALSDCFILRLVQMRGTLPPMATASLTTYFHATPDEIAAQGDAPLLGIADAKRFNANFHDQSMELWGRDNRLLVTGVQTVWYKE